MYTDQYHIINKFAQKIVEGHADSFLDLTPTLRQAPKRSTLYNDGLHYSAYGHRILADTLALEIQKFIVRAEGF